MSRVGHPKPDWWRRVVKRARAVVCLLGCVGFLVWYAGLASRGSLWVADIAVGTGVPIVAALSALVLAGVGAVRWRVLVLASVLCLPAWGVVVHDRAVWVGRGPAVDRTTGVEVLVQNVGMENSDPGGVLRGVGASGADIVVLLEPVWALFADLVKRDAAGAWYPWIESRARDDATRTGPAVVLSRWPLRRLDVPEDLGIAVVVQRPVAEGGAFVLAAVHPASPRDADRWAHGNAVVRRLCIGLDGALRTEGFSGPVLVAGDLNGGPLSWRDAALRGRLGVRRSQGLLGFGATYPANWWPLGVSIDDIWHSPGWSVRAWDTVAVPGSDHLGVRAVLSAEGPGKNETEAPGR